MVGGRRPGPDAGPALNCWEIPEPRGRRIIPANLRELPTVLDAAQASNVLRISVARVRVLTHAGELRRLTYSRQMLYSSREIVRFLLASTPTGGPTNE